MAGEKARTGEKAFRLWWPIRGVDRSFDMIASSAFINVLSLALPLTLLQIYDRIIPNTSHETLVLLVIGVCGALVLEFMLRVCRTYVNGWMGARFEHAVGCRAVRHLLACDIGAFDRVGGGVHLQRFNALHALREFYGGQALTAFCDLPFALLFIAVVAYLGGWLALLPLGLFVLFAVAAGFTGLKLRRALAQRAQSDDHRFNFLMEVLGGAETIKGLALEKQMLRRYERLQEASAKTQHSVALNSASALSLGSLFSLLTLFSVVCAGALLVIDGKLTVGALAACTMLSSRAMQPLQRAVGVWTRFQTARLAEQQLRAHFELPLEAEAPRQAISDMVGNITLDHVSFRYANAPPTLLEDVSINICAGDMVAITGASASGKTTLLQLITGLNRPNSGRVLVDGVDIADLDPNQLRHNVAYVPQRVFLFEGTIRENLTMFRPQFDDAAMELAEAVGLDDVVARLPLGYETRVSAGTFDPVTYGVRQQMAIVRALAPSPCIVLFDEANSAFDKSQDAILQRVLTRLRGQRTLVIVTHRPSMLALADRVLLIRDGRVTEQERIVRPLATTPPDAPEHQAFDGVPLTRYAS